MSLTDYHLAELAAAIARLERDNRRLRDEVELLRRHCDPTALAQVKEVLAEQNAKG